MNPSSPRKSAGEATDALDEILEVEKASSEMLDAERAKAALWLEQTKAAIEQSTASEIAQLEARAAQDEAVAKQAATTTAAGIVQQAESLAGRMMDLDEDRLKQIVWKHVATIVPRLKT